MSQARSKTTPRADVEQRRLNRASARDRAAQAVADLQAWRKERQIKAQKAEAAAIKARRAAAYGKRGVDRVPDSILDAPELTPTREVEPQLGRYTLPDGRTLVANHAQRRDAGQRGKPRPHRRRELPRAVQARQELGR